MTSPQPCRSIHKQLTLFRKHHMHRRFWLGIGVLVLLPGLTWAARPLDTEDPGTVPQGQGELQGVSTPPGAMTARWWG
jgi:hypothetical protein